jgi:hypothetical protein
MDERRNARPARDARVSGTQDGFLQAAAHAITRTVPRRGRREPLVPRTLTIGIAMIGLG